MKFEEATAAVNAELCGVLGSFPGILRAAGEHLAAARGKLLRARLLLAASADADGDVPAAAVRLAAAVELLHLASLVHDDIIDRAELRRGQDSVWKKFGVRNAVIAGDYLLCRALETASQTLPSTPETAAYLARLLRRICEGEALELVNNQNFTMGVRDYLGVIQRKTAALLGASLRLGAMLAKRLANESKMLERFGVYLGMAFQIYDDLTDCTASSEVTGKDAGNDIKQGVVTLPLLLAVRRCGKPAAEEMDFDEAAGMAGEFRKKAAGCLAQMADPILRGRLKMLLDGVEQVNRCAF